MDSKCPSCDSTDWLSVGHGQRRHAKCRQCGQMRLLYVRGTAPSPAPPTEVSASLRDLFPAADRQ